MINVNTMRYRVLRAAVDIHNDTRDVVTVPEVIEYIRRSGLRNVPTRREVTNFMRAVFEPADGGGFIIRSDVLAFR